ncbi:MAG: hypothetical protein RR522_00150 [Alistipes sp.]
MVNSRGDIPRRGVIHKFPDLEVIALSLIDARKQLQKIAHLLRHTNKESFVGMLEMWYATWGEYFRLKWK